MTPPGSRFRRRLTDDEMDLLRMVTKARGSLGGCRALWDLMLLEAEGCCLTDAETECRRFDVRDYAIPADQDREIQRLLSVPPSRASRKRWSRRQTCTTFLMYGPATYDDE